MNEPKKYKITQCQIKTPFLLPEFYFELWS